MTARNVDPTSPLCVNSTRHSGKQSHAGIDALMMVRQKESPSYTRHIRVSEKIYKKIKDMVKNRTIPTADNDTRVVKYILYQWFAEDEPKQVKRKKRRA